MSTSRIVKTHGIVLHVTPVTETSRVVVWMTSNFGKIATMVKGSQRPKSAFLGQYDLFYSCELLFYPRPRTHLHIARECSPLATRPELRGDWKAAACASYVVELTARISQSDTPQESVYTLLEHTLNHLAAGGAKPGVLFWFELSLLRRLGFAPRLSHCVQCGKAIPPRARGLRFLDERGGLLCSSCSRTRTGEGQSVTPDLLALLSAWTSSTTAAHAATAVCTARQAGRLEQMIGSFLIHHLDLRTLGRGIAFQTLRMAGAPSFRKKALRPLASRN